MNAAPDHLRYYEAIIMVDCFLSGVVLLAIVFVSAVLLGLRDSVRNQKEQESRPIGDRIVDIQEFASSSLEELPDLQTLLQERNPDDDKAWFWIEPVIEFTKRLEQLAHSSEASSDEARKLANEAGQYLRENNVKGVFVAAAAYKLAKLIDIRNKENNKGVERTR